MNYQNQEDTSNQMEGQSANGQQGVNPQMVSQTLQNIDGRNQYANQTQDMNHLLSYHQQVDSLNQDPNQSITQQMNLIQQQQLQNMAEQAQIGYDQNGVNQVGQTQHSIQSSHLNIQYVPQESPIQQESEQAPEFVGHNFENEKGAIGYIPNSNTEINGNIQDHEKPSDHDGEDLGDDLKESIQAEQMKGQLDEMFDEEENKEQYLDANVFQISMLNKMLPKAYKFDILEIVKKQMEAHSKKTSGLANFSSKKPQIANEEKQKKIYERYNQRRLREQQKLEQKQKMLIMNQEKEQQKWDDMHQKQKAAQNQTKVKPKENTIPFKPFKTESKLSKQNSISINKEDLAQMGQFKKKTSKFYDDGLSEDEDSKPIKGKNKPITKKKEIMPIFKTDSNIRIEMSNGDDMMLLNQKSYDGVEPKLQKHVPLPYVNNTINPSMMPGQDDLKNGEPIKKKRGRKPLNHNANPGAQNLQLNKDQSKVDNTDIIAKNPRGRKQKNKQSEKQSGGASDQNDQIEGNFTIGQSNFNINENGNEQVKSQSCSYDSYIQLLESIISHECLQSLTEIPLFLNPTDKLLNAMKKENSGNGYLNFHMILQRLKAKKYGPGKNSIKEDIIQSHIRNVFRICEKYYNFEKSSMKISFILEQFFENEILNIQPDQNQGDLNDREKKKRDKALKKEKKEKKKNKKRNRNELNDSDEDVNSNVFNEQEQAKKKLMYEHINNQLTVEQKKGIVPIIQPKVDGKPSQQKFEFDLFSIPPAQYTELEEYVNKCLKINKGQTDENNKDEDGKAGDEMDDIQNQIDQKLKENNIKEDRYQNISDSQNDQSFEQEKQKAEEYLFDVKKKGPPKFYDVKDDSPYEEDRHLLIKKISSLENKQLKGILPIVREYQSAQDADNEEKLEFDLYELSDKKLKELHNYVEKCLIQNKDANEKAEQEKAVVESTRQMMEQMQQNQSQNMMEQQMKLQAKLQEQIVQQQQQQQQQFSDEQIKNPSTVQDIQQMIYTNQAGEIQKSQNEKDELINKLFSKYYQKDDQDANATDADFQNKRMELVNAIQTINQDQMPLLGCFICTKQYLELDGPVDPLVQQQQMIQNNSQIELDVNKISINQIKLLKLFIENPSFQGEFSKIIYAQPSVNQGMPGNPQNVIGAPNEISPEIEQLFANYDPKIYQQWEIQQKNNNQAQVHAYEEMQNQINANIKEQMMHLQETTQLVQFLNSQAVDEQSQSQLQQCSYNEQIVKQNISNLQQYLQEQTHDYEVNTQQNLLIQNEKEALHQQYLQWVQSKTQLQQQQQPGPLVQDTQLVNQMIDQPKQQDVAQPTVQQEIPAQQPNFKEEKPQQPEFNENQPEPKEQIQPAETAPIQEQEAPQQPVPDTTVPQPDQDQNAQNGTQQQVTSQDIQLQLQHYAYQHNLITQELNQKIDLSTQLQQIYQQCSYQVAQLQQSGQDPAANQEAIQQAEVQIQQIQEQHSQCQLIIQQLNQNQKVLEQNINILQQQQQTGKTDGKEGIETKVEEIGNQNPNAQKIQQQNGEVPIENEQLQQQQQQQQQQQLQQQQELNQYYMQMQQQQQLQMQYNQQNGQPLIAQEKLGQETENELIQKPNNPENQMAQDMLIQQEPVQDQRTPFNTQINHIQQPAQENEN